MIEKENNKYPPHTLTNDIKNENNKHPPPTLINDIKKEKLTYVLNLIDEVSDRKINACEEAVKTFYK